MADASNFVDLVEPVARRLLGEPNKTLSSRDQLRFGTRGSIAVQIAGPKKGTWFDHEAGCGGGVLDLVRNCQRLVDGEAVRWLEEQGFIPEREQRRKVIVAIYDYLDEQATRLSQVVRYDPKDFRQRSPDCAGEWKWNTKGVRQVLYRLPALITAVIEGRIVYVAEGERGVHALEAIGLVGTCSPGGAGKWRGEYSGALRGADVIILPDNDEVGRRHAQQVTTALRGVARRVRVLPLPDLPEKLAVLAIGAQEPAPEQEDDTCEDPPQSPHPSRPRQRWANDPAFVWPVPLDFLTDPDGEAPELTHRQIPPAINDFTFDTAERMGVDQPPSPSAPSHPPPPWSPMTGRYNPRCLTTRGPKTRGSGPPSSVSPRS